MGGCINLYVSGYMIIMSDCVELDIQYMGDCTLSLPFIFHITIAIAES